MPGYDEALEQAIEQTIFKTVNTLMIAEITKVEDAEKGLVEVLPVVNKIQNDKSEEYEKIPGVPLCGLNFGELSIQMSEKNLVGSFVLLGVCQRSIDTWKNTGNVQEPEINTKYDIADSVAILGVINPKKGSKNPIIGDTTKIMQGDSYIEFESNGTVNINGHLTVKK